MKFLHAAMKLDPVILMDAVGMKADKWQSEFLRCTDDRVMLLCSRQSGKSTSSAIKALHVALFEENSLVLLCSPSLRQSGELFKKVAGFYAKLDKPVVSEQETALTLTLANGSRIISLPGTPDTIRGYSAVRMLLVDEAAMVSDDLFIAATPMLAVSHGSMCLLSSPKGQRGYFYNEWEGKGNWKRFRITAWDCPRVTKEFLEEERRSMGDRYFRQEYEACFEATVDQVFSSESVEDCMRGCTEAMLWGGV